MKISNDIKDGLIIITAFFCVLSELACSFYWMTKWHILNAEGNLLYGIILIFGMCICIFTCVLCPEEKSGGPQFFF